MVVKGSLCGYCPEVWW